MMFPTWPTSLCPRTLGGNSRQPYVTYRSRFTELMNRLDLLRFRKKCHILCLWHEDVRELPGQGTPRKETEQNKTVLRWDVARLSMLIGSLREDIEPLHMVVPDQLVDRTRGRASTFFGEGIVAHIAFADPFCPELRTALAEATRQEGATVHNGGTLVVIEGPAFSTRAESNLYRSWGADIIGMTALPEAKLAREAEICYAILACSTDYDVWHDTHEDVSAEMIVANLLRNVEVSRNAVRLALGRLPDVRNCACPHALRDAIITRLELAPEESKRRLEPIIGHYVVQEVAGG